MQSLVLRDGRSLAYCWFGAPWPPAQPASPPPPATHEAAAGAGCSAAAAAAAAPSGVLVHFHGFLSSRLEAALLDGDARHLGLSVLAVDRPGHGGSTLNPGQVPLQCQLPAHRCTSGASLLARVPGCPAHEEAPGMDLAITCSTPSSVHADSMERGTGRQGAAGQPGPAFRVHPGRFGWVPRVGWGLGCRQFAARPACC